VPGEELGRVRVATVAPRLQQTIEVAHHHAIGGQRLRRDLPDRVGEALEIGVQHLPAQTLLKGVEALARGRLQEVVLLESPDPSAGILRQRLQRRLTPVGHLGQHAPERLVAGRLARSVADPPLDTPALGLDDRRQLFTDIGQHVAQLVSLQQLAAALCQAAEQLPQPSQILPARPLTRPVDAPLHQPAERLGDVPFGHQVVGERLQDLVGRQ
jgi:hypothetical protein